MNIKSYLDSTYLKTPTEAGISVDEDLFVVTNTIQEAIDEDFKLIMIRPNHVFLAKKMIDNQQSKVLVGTVIDFPEGTSSVEKKLIEAEIAINDGADELDFVCNYQAFKRGKIDLLKEEIYKCTSFCLQKNKTIKWIIEVAALTENEIVEICKLIKSVIIENFEPEKFDSIFVKSSTGFFKTENNLPNGATIPSITMMLEHAKPLPIKAAGGIKSYAEAIEMISLGVTRIGTSAAKNMAFNKEISENY